jgi:hypothetical protein
VRIARGDAGQLTAEDVAWVAEWQLALLFPWVPIGEESPVSAAPAPDASQRSWQTEIHVGGATIQALLPVRELERVIQWCYRVPRFADLLHPPPAIRASLQGIRRALRKAVRSLDPLAAMGYRSGQHQDLGPGRS